MFSMLCRLCEAEDSHFYDNNGYDNDSSMSYVHGVMGYYDDFRLTFCIV